MDSRPRTKVDDRRARRQPGGEPREPSRDGRPIARVLEKTRRNGVIGCARPKRGVVGHQLILGAVRTWFSPHAPA